MSEFGISIWQAANTPLPQSLAPWSCLPHVSMYGQWKDLAILNLISGKETIYSGINSWYSGYLPRKDAVSGIDLSVDLDGGGDYEQLRTVTVQIADQMSDGSSMWEWLSIGQINLAGAMIRIHYPFEPDQTTAPRLWMGIIKQSRLSDTKIILQCESPSDSDAMGEVVTDSAIRPIIYGEASKVKLPALDVDTKTISPLTQVYRAFAPHMGTAPRLIANSDSAGFVNTWTDPVTGRSFVALATGPYECDLSGYFPNGEVPDSSDWYLECVAGKGKGAVRRLKAGVPFYHFGYTPPQITTLPNPFNSPSPAAQDIDAVKASETAHLWIFEVDYPFLDPSDQSPLLQGILSRTYDSNNNPTDHWVGGATEELMIFTFHEFIDDYSDYLRWAINPPEDRSHISIVRKGLRFSLPICSGFSAKSPINVKTGDKYLRVDNAEELFRIDSGARTLSIIPSATSATNATAFTRLVPNWDTIAVVSEPTDAADDNPTFVPPTIPLASQLSALLDGTPSSYRCQFRIRPIIDVDDHPLRTPDPYWGPSNHVCIAMANPDWDLDGVSKLLLCLDATAVQLNNDGQENRCVLIAGMQAHRSSLLESYWSPYFPEFPGAFKKSSFKYLPGYNQAISVNTMPPHFYSNPGAAYNWITDAIQMDIDSKLQAGLAYISLFVGCRRNGVVPAVEESQVRLDLRQLAVFAVRDVSLSQVYVDLFGPTYDSVWTQRFSDPGTESGYNHAVPLANGVAAASPIHDHVHAYEDVFRRHVPSAWIPNPVDGDAIERACTDLWSKTQFPSGSSFPVLPEDQRPRAGFAITDSSPQVGDVAAQLCRDSNLVGCRNAVGARTATAWLARTLLEEQDATLEESDIFRASISELGSSQLSKLCSAPLIRYGQQAGAPTQYIQVTRPDAPAWDPSYTAGFPDQNSAQRAWNICHRGYLESGLAQAREIRMDTHPDINSLLAIVMQPRGTTFLDWISRPKNTLTATISLKHPAAILPRGSRILLYHWKYAPSGKRGTLRRANLDVTNDSATLEIILDLAP